MSLQKPPHKIVSEWAAQNSVRFVSRSHGQATTETMSKASLDGLVAYALSTAEAQGVPDGYALVSKGALQMVVNVLQRDAINGMRVRGEIVEQLLASAPPAPQAEPILPSDVETDCEPAPQEVVEHQSPAPQTGHLRAEAQKLSKILAGMGEGGYDLETLYTTDQADGDAFVRRAADLLVELASALPAPQAKQTSVVQPVPVIESDMFWDHKDPEEFGHDIGDIVCNYGPGDKVKIDCAFRMQTITVLVKEGCDYEIVSGSVTHPAPQASRVQQWAVSQDPLTQLQVASIISERDAAGAGSPKRCEVCNYQHGHQIGCANNPVDIALKAQATVVQNRAPVFCTYPRCQSTGNTCTGQCAAQPAPQASAVQQEPLGFISPKQVERIVDPDGEFGAYIPMRKTPAGNFTLAIYTHPAPQAKPLTHEQKWEMWTAATIEQPSARDCYFRGVEDAETKHGIK